MNMPDLGLDALKPLKEAYLREVGYHLSIIPTAVQSLIKRIGKKAE
jgi:hypothetical protein